MPQVMGVKAVLHHWILDFLRTRVQTVKSQRHVMPIDVNTGALQGCVLSSLLLSNYTNNLRSHHHSVKFFTFFMQMTPPSSAYLMTMTMIMTVPQRGELGSRLVQQQQASTQRIKN